MGLYDRQHSKHVVRLTIARIIISLFIIAFFSFFDWTASPAAQLLLFFSTAAEALCRPMWVFPFLM